MEVVTTAERVSSRNVCVSTHPAARYASSSIPRRLYARSRERAGFASPRPPMCALRFAPDKRTPRAKNSWEEMGGPHGPGRGAERLRSPRPACLASAPARLWYVWYANSYSVLRTCSAYGRCVVRLWAAHVCRSFLSDRLKCSTSIRTYGIEGTPIVSNMRLSRGTLDSRGVGM